MKKCKLIEESIDKDTVKQWYICQIEDKRAEITAAQEITQGELDLENLHQQMKVLDEEKKRRGYK